MPQKQQSISIFLFEVSGLVIYCVKQPQGTNFPFPSGSVEHMELCNFDLLRDLITQACVTLELSETTGLVVFGPSLTFEKQIPPQSEDKLQEQIDLFRDSTPFERVATHSYKNQQGHLLVSINRDFYDTVRQLLERSSVHVVGIIPQLVLAQKIGKTPIQQKTLTLLKSSIDQLVMESMITHKAMPKTLQEQQEYISKKYSGVLIAAFLLFLCIVIGGTFFILRSQFSATRSSTQKAMTIVTAPPEATSVPAPSPETSDIATQSATLRITITHVPEVASQAAKLAQALRTDTNTQVILQTQSGLQTSKPLLVFKQSVPPARRVEIQNQIQVLFPTVTIQEIAQLDTDVSVTLGK